MTAPTRNDGPGLSRREEMTVSGATLSSAPWRAAGAAGVVVTGADLALHLIGGHLAVSSSLSAGIVAVFAVAGAGALWRARSGRAARWARSNPWRFALLPGVAAAALVFVLSVVIGSSGVFGGAFTAIWHGAVAYGVTGLTGTVAGGRRRRAA
jgi:hypothetical protein